MDARSPLLALGLLAASLMRAAMASFCASKTYLLSLVFGQGGGMHFQRSRNQSIHRLQGRSPGEGLLCRRIADNTAPEVWNDQPIVLTLRLDGTACANDMIDPIATGAAAAMKSGGHGISPASSTIQARSTSGSSVSVSNAGTGFSSAMMGLGSYQPSEIYSA
jgi:hypothetical protein